MYEAHLNALADAWSTGNLDQLDEYLATDTVREAPRWMDTTANNLADLKRIITEFRTSFPDGKVTLEEMAFGKDLSFAKWTFSGTNTGPGEFEPTGKSIRIEGASVHHYENGKLKQEIVYFDAADFFSQLGLMDMSKAAAG